MLANIYLLCHELCNILLYIYDDIYIIIVLIYYLIEGMQHPLLIICFYNPHLYMIDSKQEKNQEDCPLTTRLESARAQVQSISQALQSLQESCGLQIDPSDSPTGTVQWVGLNFGLAAVVYEWARGVSFKEITNMTLTHEGSVVRTITRLDELCKDFRNAARVVGNPSLYRKMEATSQCIKRDIVFAASLYVS
jgi:antiviral helicase SKI2